MGGQGEELALGYGALEPTDDDCLLPLLLLP